MTHNDDGDCPCLDVQEAFNKIQLCTKRGNHNCAGGLHIKQKLLDIIKKEVINNL